MSGHARERLVTKSQNLSQWAEAGRDRPGVERRASGVRPAAGHQVARCRPDVYNPSADRRQLSGQLSARRPHLDIVCRPPVRRDTVRSHGIICHT